MRRALLSLCAAFFLFGCGATPLSERWNAERDLWRATKLLRRVANKPEAAGPLRDEARAALEGILSRYPITKASGDPRETLWLGEVRALAALRLVPLYREDRAVPKAVGLLRGLRPEVRGDLELALRIHTELVALLTQPLSADTLVEVLREAAADLPPATADGTPIPLVVEAPLKAAEVLEGTGQAARASAEYELASTYYQDLIRRGAGGPLEVVASIHLAKVDLKRGHAAEAESRLQAARALPGAGPYEARILFSQASIRQAALRDPRSAIPLYAELERRFPGDDIAPDGMIQCGLAWADAGRADSAIAVLDRAARRYARNADAAGTARLSAVRVLVSSGKEDEGIRRLRALAADFPETSAGLLAPLEVASIRERVGDSSGRDLALREAAAGYEQLIRSHEKDPQSRELVRRALDLLGEASERLGDWTRAVSAYMARAESYPEESTSPLLYVRAAGLLEDRLKDREGAISTLEKLLARYPELPISPQVQAKIAQLRGSP